MMIRMDLSKHFAATVIFAIVMTVCPDPNCQIYEEREVVCVADIEDYVLRKGLVSEILAATRITLINCRITDIEPGAFEHIYYLQYLDLSGNKLKSLKPGVLDGNVQMTHLNLSNNMLTTFPSGIFDQKPNVEVLDLNHNRINSLSMDLFVVLRKLIHLDLSYNDFQGKDISPYMFSKNRKIKYLDFSSNDMSNTPENVLQALQELDYLNLDRCSLNHVPQFATRANLRTMKHLILSTNLITQIDQARTFMNLENLEFLNLADNFIENIPVNVFIHLKKIKVIILRNNKLKTLPDIFKNLVKLEIVDLSRNLLEYIPINAFRGTMLQELNLSSNRFSYLEAYFCVQLRNAGIRIKKLYVDNNPWQCACLNDIINEMKTFGIAYNGAKYNGEFPVCVTSNIFRCKRQPLDNKYYLEMYDNAINQGNDEA